jgi:hypothetical protein
LGRTYHESKRRPVYLVRRFFEPKESAHLSTTQIDKPDA